MAKTTFAEEIYLRALTGKVVGEAVMSAYNKVAVISVRNVICSAISAAAEATFVSKTNGRSGHFIVEAGNVDAVVKQVAEFAPNAVVLMFGGETPIEETRALFVETLQALAKANLAVDIIVHVRIFAAGGLQAAVADTEVARYLDERPVFVYTVNFDEGLVLYNRVRMEGDQPRLTKLAEVPVTVEHADLLNRSLRDRTVAWVEA